MDKEAKAKIILASLEEAAFKLGASKISQETLFDGVNLYLKTWNPPKKPFDPFAKKDSLSEDNGLTLSSKKN